MSSNRKKCIVFGPGKRLCVGEVVSACLGMIKVHNPHPAVKEFFNWWEGWEHEGDFEVPGEQIPIIADFLDKIRECSEKVPEGERAFAWPDWLEAMVPARRQNIRKLEAQATVAEIELWLRERQITVADAERKLREHVYQSGPFLGLTSERREAIIKAVMIAMTIGGMGLGAAALYNKRTPHHSGLGIPGTYMR